LVLASWLIALFTALNRITLPRAGQIKLDGAVLAFTCTLSLLTSVVCGLMPGLQSSRVNLVEELKDRQRGSHVGLGGWLRGRLVIAQVALLVLLVGAGLLSQTFIRLITLQAGYNPENLLTLQLFVPFDKYPENKQVAALYQRATAEFQSLPGAQAVGAVSASAQFGGYESTDFLAEGQPAPPTGEYPQARYFDTSPNYFHTMQIPVLKGREFTEHDQAGAPGVAIINETLAKRFWPNANPVGQRINLVRSKRSLEIVGVVGDVRRYGLGAQVEPEIYWPYLQQTRWAIYFVLRTNAAPASFIFIHLQTGAWVDAQQLDCAKFKRTFALRGGKLRIFAALQPPRQLV
jgi:putative ABC transport system permease protein